MRFPFLPALTAVTALTILVALSPAETNTAHAQTIYNDVASFNAAAAGNTLYNFEGIAPSGGTAQNPNLAPLTISITSDGFGGNYFVFSGTNNNGNFSLNGTDALFAGFTSNDANPAITRIGLGGPGQTFTAFATEIGQERGVSNQYSFALYLGDTQVGTTYTSPLNTPSDTFVGITTTNALTFDNVRITTLRLSSSFTLFDNIRTLAAPISAVAAPEPGSLALLLPVAGLAGMVIRKRKTSK